MSNPQDLYAVIRQLRPAFKQIAKAVEIRANEAGLNTGMRAILEILLQAGPSTVPQLAQNLQVERQYIQRNCNQLLDRSLITKEANPKHKRSWNMAVTETGKSAFERLHDNEMHLLQSIAENCTLQEMQNAEKVLKLLGDRFRQLNLESEPS